MGIFKADDSQGQERHKGYVRALQEEGIPYNPNQVIWFHTEDRKNKPAMAVQRLLREGERPDGIVCYNDQIAVQVIEAVTSMGWKVPEDISVTGYDNSVFAKAQGIVLTTIAHPQEKLGEMAAELLLEKIRGVSEQDSRVKRLIDPELVQGDSCKAR